MAAADEERKAQIDAWLEKQARADVFYCPYLRATLTYAACVERHQRNLEKKWLGGNYTDALSSLQEKFCVKCKLGKLHARRLRNERRNRRMGL